jgi:3-oxoadipate enol-lactonase
MPYADAGSRLWYRRQGRGDPLLWITGFGISAAILEPVADRYVGSFECVVYDPRGAGRSAAPLRPASIATHAGDAVRLLDALGIGAALVYGVSWGGIVAQEVALRFPERVRGLVLGGTPAIGPRAPLPRPGQLGASGLLAAGLTGGWAVGEPRLAGPALFSARFRRDHPRQVRALLELLTVHRPTVHGLAGQWLATLAHDTSLRLRGIRAPTLLLRGADDVLVPPAHVALLADRIPAAELTELPRAGHLYLHERPDEAYEALTDWLARRPG